MKLSGNYQFEAPQPVVWEALFDPQVLARTLPGCDKLEREGDVFSGAINVKMGPVQGKFQGRVEIQEVVDGQSYRMVIDGRGPAGFAKATADIALSASGGGTEMKYDSEVKVGGRIASVGQRLLDASSRAIVKQSLESLHAQIKSLVAADSGPVEAGEPAIGPGNTQSESPAEHDGSMATPAPAASEPARRPPRDDPPADAPQGPSQAAFAFGVAKEVSRELFPIKRIVALVALVVLAWAVYQVLAAR